MKPEIISLKISKKSLEPFVICLVLGTLTAIKDGSLTPDSGIWTFGRPNFWKHLEETQSVSQQVIEILKSADELDALNQLAGNTAMIGVIDGMISNLKCELSKCSDQDWYAEW